MNVAVFTDVKPEDKDAILAILDKLGATDDDTVVSETKRKKTRSEINHQNYLNRKAKQSEKSDSQTEEEREEKEAVPPLSSPLPSSPNPLSPIPPIIPPSQEREEREEPDMGSVAKPKHRHGEFGHVLLTDTDLDRLKDKFPDWQERIQRLDDYLEMHRKKHYDNHYLTICNWAKKDGKQEKTREPEKQFDYMDILKDMEWEGCNG